MSTGFSTLLQASPFHVKGQPPEFAAIPAVDSPRAGPARLLTSCKENKPCPIKTKYGQRV
jgi:hypothetical protein